MIALALANLGFYAWTQGWLDTLTGVRANGDREPERLARQVRPETVQILSPAVASAALAAAAPGPACLEAGPFSPTEIAAAEAAVQAALPAGSWAQTRTERPGVWIVYMGKYPNPEALARKKEELQRIKVDFDELPDASELAPGLAIGRFDERAKAEQGLAQFAQRGVRSARVVELQAASITHLLRVDHADAALAEKVRALKEGALGKGFAVCAAGGDSNR